MRAKKKERWSKESEIKLYKHLCNTPIKRLISKMVSRGLSLLRSNLGTSHTNNMGLLPRGPCIRFFAVSCCVSVAFGILLFTFPFGGWPSDLQDRHANAEEFEGIQEKDLWKAPSHHGLGPCTDPTKSYTAPHDWGRYLLVQSNGGLNQMRVGICDMVAAARIMNATLVIPKLDKRSFWHDSSVFSDIFDEDHFVKTLEGDVKILKELPSGLESLPKARKHFTTWSGVRYYEEMAHLWKEYRVIHVAKSDSRLANNYLPIDIQRLRCRALYQALRFAAPIELLGKKLVDRMRKHGPYIALHLRYEKDMLAFTGCAYGLRASEAEELTTIRENTHHWKIKKINSTDQRVGGYCPLTPKEVGILLQALGYPPSTWIYIAAGEIYGGRKRLAELKSRFPNLAFKGTIARPSELESFANHASQMAALDYILSVESNVFIPSYSGNMARAVEGHRRFLGHRKTIIPDRKGLVALFDNLERGELQEGLQFSLLVKEMHKLRQGAPRKRKGSLPGIKGRSRFRTEEAFYENPFPECICRKLPSS